MNLLSDVVSVSMNPSSMYLRKMKSPVVSVLVKKTKFAHEQHQVGDLPAVITAHRHSLDLLVNSAACNKKIFVVNEIVQVK